jgi:hypothetical protein
MSLPGLVLLTRQDCTLCEEFQQEFVQWAGALSNHRSLPPLRVQDVDADPLLQRRYGLQVPVLLWEGVRVCAARFDPAELNRLLKARANP